jgi:hypothetical protein
MPIDANIAMGVKPIQFESPINSLSQIMQLQGLQQGNQLNQMKMDEYGRGVQEQNALRSVMGGQGFDIGNPEHQRQLLAASPTKGAALLDQFSQMQERKAKGEKDTFGVAKDRYNIYQTTLGVLKDAPNLSKDMVMQAGQGLVSQGILTNEMYQKAVQGLPDDPTQIRMVLENGLKSQMSPKDIFEVFAPKMDYKDSGQQLIPVNTNPLSPGYVAPTAIQKVATPDSVLSSNTTKRGQNMTDSRAREANQLTREGNQTQIVVDPTRGPILINKQTGVARNAVGADGKPIQGEVSSKREASAKNLITVLDEADGLIDKATGSYLGAGVDQVGRVFGGATGGDKAIAQLKVLEGNLMMNQPRMEGPQSDKDVLLYRQNAGQIGDQTVPNSIKKAALKEIRKITEKYAGVAPAADDIHAQADAILRGGK